MTTTTATVTVSADGTAVLDLADGQPLPLPLHADSIDEARRQSIAMVMGHARSTGQAVTVLARDPDAEHLLEILPDGTVRPAPTPTTPPAGSAFAPPDDPAATPTAEGPDINPVPPAAPTPPPQAGGTSQDPAQPRTAAVLLPPAPPAAPAVNTRRRAWPLAAVGAVGLGTAAALWLWSHGSTAPTMSTAQTAPTTSDVSNADTAPTPMLDGATLGVTAAARSTAPRPKPMPGTATPVSWNSAAAWQEQRDRKAAALPAQATAAPALPAPAAQPATPTNPAPAVAGPARQQPPATRPSRPHTSPPSVTVYPDPVIQPDAN